MAPPKRYTGGQAKPEELDVPEMPQAHSLWMATWKKVDQNANQNKLGIIDPGYRFPKATLFVNVTTPERKKIYLLNWLSSWALWISRVDSNTPSKFPSPQMWRDFLNTINVDPDSLTKSASKKLVTLEILGDEIIQSARGLGGAPEEIAWQGMQVSPHHF